MDFLISLASESSNEAKVRSCSPAPAMSPMPRYDSLVARRIVESTYFEERSTAMGAFDAEGQAGD